MDKVKFKLNLSGLNELMRGAEMQGVLTEAANRIAGAAGSGYEIEAGHPIRFVAIAAVHAETAEAKKDARENDTLLKAAGGVTL